MKVHLHFRHEPSVQHQNIGLRHLHAGDLVGVLLVPLQSHQRVASASFVQDSGVLQVSVDYYTGWGGLLQIFCGILYRMRTFCCVMVGFCMRRCLLVKYCVYAYVMASGKYWESDFIRDLHLRSNILMEPSAPTEAKIFLSLANDKSKTSLSCAMSWIVAFPAYYYRNDRKCKSDIILKVI